MNRWPKPLLLFLLAALVCVPATGCGNKSKTVAPQSAKDYYAEMNKSLDAVTTANDEWTAAAARVARIDVSKLSFDDATALDREMLAAATKLNAAAAGATILVQKVTPPAMCANTHAEILKALQFTERGSLELKTYFENGLRSGAADESQKTAGVGLLGQADQVKVTLQTVSTRDGCE